MTIGYREGVAIGEIAVYVPCLMTAIFLAIRHGFGRSAGWFFLIILSLARIIGASMQIATSSNPNNISLYTGSAILTNIGFSPLMLATLGLLSRLIDSINRNKKIFLTAQYMKLIELLILVAAILGVVGGTQAGDKFSKTNTFVPQPLSKVGTALLIVSFALIIITTVMISFQTPHAEEGEHRIFFAVAASLPFMLVRLVYSGFSTFSHLKSFSLVNGNVTCLLCIALLEELAVVIIYEVMGLTLRKLPKAQVGIPVASRDSSEPMAQGQYRAQAQPKQDSTALKIFKHTIIGRIVFAFIPSGDDKGRDVEMQGQHYQK
ncbi:hypothetical protein LSUE1_G007688 [Lachnellula suecica]|uniref:DUF7702 domain-containing protein n=1 Tax=Lachnellula suecica TaxID=602035 RepID=A0A8T9BUZ5_9HELO|nr:hypothetical protein LSUE1_G007688 [Lachnellula suecica]